MKRDIMEKKMKQAEKLQKENLQLVKLKVHENEMKWQRVKDNFKNQQWAENKKRIQAYKAQWEAMIQQSKWFFKNESERKAQLRK